MCFPSYMDHYLKLFFSFFFFCDFFAKLTCFALDVRQKSEAVPSTQKSSPNPSDTQYRGMRNILLTSSSRSALQFTDILLFPLRFIACALCAWAINQSRLWLLIKGGRKSVRTDRKNEVFTSDPSICPSTNPSNRNDPSENEIQRKYTRKIIRTFQTV